MTNIVLFRYRSVNDRLFEALSESTLYFAPPGALNDPFDCQVDIATCLSKAIDESKGATRKYLETLQRLPNFSSSLQDALLKIGICSFSQVMDDPLLWTHYADDHRGVCLTYQFPEQFFLDEQNRIIGLAPVDYGESPLREWFKNNAQTLGTPAGPQMGVELSKKLFTVKGTCWAYEKEVRAIREVPGLLNIPREYLAQICFGLRTSSEDMRLVQSHIQHPEVSYCQMVHGATDFGIEAKEI